MNWTPQNVDDILNKPEGENLEFKEARNRYDFEKLTQYCVALANEGGGKIILGVTDSRPRRVVGSNAFRQPERTRAGLNQRLHLGITFDEVFHPNGRVLVFHVPSRPGGIAIQYDGRYLVRDNDSLVGMPGERLSEIVAEAGHDFSADSCPDLTMDDLEAQAIEHFRQRWINKRGDSGLSALSREQLLADIEAVTDNGVTYAALVLFGSRAAMRKHLAQAEVVFEYRSSNAAGPAQQREEFTEAFFLWYDRLWELVNLRNDQQHYQDGMFVLDVPMFSERAVREAILNAVSHRREEPVSDDLRPCTNHLIELGMVVRAGRDRFILSEAFYRFQNRKETYRRLREREDRKELLERHLAEFAVDGCSMRELEAVLANLNRKAVRKLLDELRDEERIHLRGKKRGARWYSGGFCNGD